MAERRSTHTTPDPNPTVVAPCAPDFVLCPDPTAPARLTTAPPACPVPELSRAPLVPDAVLRAHAACVPGDTRFRGAARLLSSLWRSNAGLPLGTYQPGNDPLADPVPLGSRLHPDAARSGANFISPEVHALVRRELVLREEGAAIDEERLFANALSSMPLTFNILGPLALDPSGLGTAVFRALLPDFVARVERVSFETSPGRRDPRFLDDATAFDAAVHVIAPDGTPGTAFIEIKYSEGMTGPAARHRGRYDEASREVRLYKDPDSPVLRSLALEQLWREHMLAQLAVDQGVTPQARFLAIGPQLNQRVQAAFRCYATELADPAPKDDSTRVGFAALTLETVVLALGQAGARDFGRQVWLRYLDFGRVPQVALDETSPPNPQPPSAHSKLPRRDGPGPITSQRTGSSGIVRVHP